MVFKKGDYKHSIFRENITKTNSKGAGEGDSIPYVYDNPALSLTGEAKIENFSEFQGSRDFILINESNKSSKLKSFVSDLSDQICKKCSKKTVYKRLPILAWLPKYNRTSAVGDLIAGLTVGLTVIPQALAYSSIAGVPSQYGLYSSFLCSFVYIFLGSCKDVPMGPTAIAALLTFQATQGKGIEHAILLSFFSGCIQLFMGIFGLGFVVDFVSGPVSSGFTSAVALIILSSQMRDILGIHAEGSVFVTMWKNIFKEIHNTNPWDAILGASCIAVLLIMRIIGQFKVGHSDSYDDEAKSSKISLVINKLIWLFSTARNAIIVVVCGFIGYSFSLNGDVPFQLIGEVPQGLPKFKLPPFAGYSKEVNGTLVEVEFLDMMAHMSAGIAIVPLIGFLETIAICKAFSDGKPVDASQELLALGVANVANSFVQAYPVSGALARSAVNNASGVRTPLGSLYTGLLVIVSLLFFTPYFFYIPKAALAAIIIAAVIFMVEVKVVKPMWRSKKSDLLLGLATFIACLVLPLEIGILVGIGLNLLFILYHAARPKISIDKATTHQGTDYLMVTPDRCLIFPSTDYVRNLVTKHSIRQGIPVVIDCSHIYGADYTAATVVETLTKDFAARNQPLFFYNLKPSVSAVFEGVSPTDFVVFYEFEKLDEMIEKRLSEKDGKKAIANVV